MMMLLGFVGGLVIIFLYVLGGMIYYSWQERKYFNLTGKNFQDGLEYEVKKVEALIEKLENQIENEDLDEEEIEDLEEQIKNHDNTLREPALVAQKKAEKESKIWLYVLMKRFLVALITGVLGSFNTLFKIVNRLIVPTAPEEKTENVNRGAYR